MLIGILSLPDDWAIYKSNLHQFSSDGITATTNAFNELVDKGYIQSFQNKNSQGQFIGWNYIIYDINTNNPILGNIISENLISEDPS